MAKQAFQGRLERVDSTCWKIPKSYKKGMLVDGLVFASQKLIEQSRQDQALEQVANVACLPGIVGASLAMPDIHWGYGFCIGGVCATDPREGGVISPGGVGYDINCGVRLVRTELNFPEVQPRLRQLVEELFKKIPAGVGQSGKFHFQAREMNRLLGEGPSFLTERGWATQADIDHTEAQGYMAGADPSRVSDQAQKRGKDQCGTLGSGNHFLEIQVVDTILDPQAAHVMGLFQNQVCLMIHSGSRGLGYQVCEDALGSLRKAPEKYGIELPDRQLACAPADSPEGRAYLAAMQSAAHFAWCNRQLLMHQAREVFASILGQTWESLGMRLIYDVCHNIAKLEEHQVEGKRKKVWVHRKGATRAFPPGHPEIPQVYQEIGQPVIIPGDMGRASWILVGQQGSMERSFGTTCHGAGRLLSRTAAVEKAKGRRIDRELESLGIVARAQSWKGLAEEQPDAYKDVDEVVGVVEEAKLSKRVARLRPIGVIKG
ncbi:MAG: RtcB family protein [Gemmataceae bacterium]|nr:RtcB family protein [Gemmataceae bacterium]